MLLYYNLLLLSLSSEQDGRSSMRLVQAQLVAYRLSMERQKRRKSSSDNDDDRPVTPRQRSNSLCKQNSPNRSQSFTIPSNDDDKEPCLNEWQLMILRWVVWAVLFGIFIEMQFGTVFFVLSIFYFIYLSLRYSRRNAWEPSAYSVYNKNCEAIQGSLTAEQFDRELRYKPLS